MKLEIKSDGTRAGTVVKVDGKEVANIVDVNMSAWHGNENVYFSYTTRSMVGDMCRQETYFLADDYMMNNMKDTKYVGEKAAENTKQFKLCKIDLKS